MDDKREKSNWEMAKKITAVVVTMYAPALQYALSCNTRNLMSLKSSIMPLIMLSFLFITKNSPARPGLQDTNLQSMENLEKG